MLRMIWDIITLLIEFFILDYFKTEIHEHLHITLSKGFAIRTKFNHCDFLPGFTDKLPIQYRLLAPMISSFWDIAFGLFILNLVQRLSLSGILNEHDYLFKGNLFLGVVLSLLWVSGGIVNLFPLSGDGVSFWAIIVSVFSDNPLPDVFTNKIQMSKVSLTFSIASLAAWSIALSLLITKQVILYIFLAFVLTALLSIIHWKQLLKIQQHIKETCC